MAGREEKLVKVQLDLVLTKDHWDNVTDTYVSFMFVVFRNVSRIEKALYRVRSACKQYLQELIYGCFVVVVVVLFLRENIHVCFVFSFLCGGGWRGVFIGEH
jgi:hypothetical protein